MNQHIIYLVRHATPDWTRTDIPYHLPPGPPLTSQGEREAAELGAFLRAAGVRQIYASPLERCQRTAEIAGEVAEAPVQAEAGLAEWRPEEKDFDVRARFWPSWERAVREHGPVALLTHGGPIGLALAALGLDEHILTQYRNRFDRRNPVPPAGVWRAARPAQDAPWELSLVFTPGEKLYPHSTP